MGTTELRRISIFDLGWEFWNQGRVRRRDIGFVREIESHLAVCVAQPDFGRASFEIELAFDFHF